MNTSFNPLARIRSFPTKMNYDGYCESCHEFQSPCEDYILPNLKEEHGEATDIKCFNPLTRITSFRTKDHRKTRGTWSIHVSIPFARITSFRIFLRISRSRGLVSISIPLRGLGSFRHATDKGRGGGCPALVSVPSRGLHPSKPFCSKTRNSPMAVSFNPLSRIRPFAT